MRFFGWVDRVDDTCAVATAFHQLGGLPLWPSQSHVVDLASLELTNERWRLLFAPRQRTTFLSVPLAQLDGRSVVAGYVRSWGVLIALYALSAVFNSLILVAAGIALAILAQLFRWGSALEASNSLAIVAAALVLGSITLFTPALGIVASASALAVAVTLMWRRASASRALELAELGGGEPLAEPAADTTAAADAVDN